MDSPSAPTTANPKKNNTNPSSRASPSGNKNKRSRHQRGKNSSNDNNNNNKENGKGHKYGSGGRGNPRRKNSSSNNHRPLSQEKLSRALSWALRHAALNIGLSIREDGFVPVQEILDSTHPKLRGATLENIKLVVNNCNKQRFKLEERPRRLYYHESKTKTGRDSADTATNSSATETAMETEPETILCIRANQGHSMDLIDPERLLTKLSPEDLRSLPCIVHGTYPKAWESIHRAAENGGGLRRMNRTHIHFASGLPDAGGDGVISGMRKSCSVHVYVDASACAADDRIEFFRSDNGVILTDGVGDSGVLPIEYFSHVTDSSGKILLDNRNRNNPVR